VVLPVRLHVDGSGHRRCDAAFIDNANAALRRMRNVHGATLPDANGNPTRGILEAHLEQLGGSTLVNLNSSRPAETAGALKTLHLPHSMKQGQLGTTTLGSAFIYYSYPGGAGSDACPNPSLDINASKRTDHNFEEGLDEMVSISDNRPTRGVVLRFGMSAINGTGSAAGLTGTAIGHDIGRAYLKLSTGRYDPANLRNSTTAADLACIHQSVWLGSSLNSTNNARAEFLESAIPKPGACSSLLNIIDAEAAALGKSSSAATAFGAAVRCRSKGGGYGTCLPDSAGVCGQQVSICSAAGLIEISFKSGGVAAPRVCSYANLISDVPVTCR